MAFNAPGIMPPIQKTITIRYTPTAKTQVYDHLHHPLSAPEAGQMLKCLNRTKISTHAPHKPKGGEVYVYRSKIIGKSWRLDGYEGCWLCNGTHYYPRFDDLNTARQNALFKVLRHAAFDKAKHQKVDFRRVAYVELPRPNKDNPVVIVQYFGDETSCVIPVKKTPVSSRRRSRARKGQNTSAEDVEPASDDCILIDTSECSDVIMDHPHNPSGSTEILGDNNSSADGAPTVSSIPTMIASPLDEELREASAQGDLDRVASLLASGASVNSANIINGWTALHWAAKRNHADVAAMLLGAGADASAKSAAGKTPADVCISNAVARLLLTADTPSPSTSGLVKEENELVLTAPVEPSVTQDCDDQTGFVPNYLRNPEFHYARTSDSRSGNPALSNAGPTSSSMMTGESQLRLAGIQINLRPPLVLLARVAKSDDPDFIEVELTNRSYQHLLHLLCRELGQQPAAVERIRKLPNVRLRSDADVGRLEQGQQLELVLRAD